MMKNLDLENLDLEPHDREVKISISSRKLKKVSRRSLHGTISLDFCEATILIFINVVYSTYSKIYFKIFYCKDFSGVSGIQNMEQSRLWR